MKKSWIMFSLWLCTSLLAQTVHKSPQEIQQELDDAERQLKRAEEMFDPWYTGPLLTPSASMMPPGYANSQFYAFITQSYASFNENLLPLKPIVLISTLQIFCSSALPTLSIQPFLSKRKQIGLTAVQLEDLAICNGL